MKVHNGTWILNDLYGPFQSHKYEMSLNLVNDASYVHVLTNGHQGFKNCIDIEPWLTLKEYDHKSENRPHHLNDTR